MSDYLVNLGASPGARKAVKTLGLPIPLPQTLRRADGPWEERPLQDQAVAVGFHAGSELVEPLASAVVGLGAEPHVAADAAQMKVFAEVGEAHGRLPVALAENGEAKKLKVRALVFDATGLEHPGQLEEVYRFFQARVRSLTSCGRIVLLARPPAEAKTPAAAAASQAVDGFMRAAGKEIGRKGSTAQLVFVAKGADARVEPCLRFLLSPRSAYIDGQAITLTAAVKAPQKVSVTRPLEGKVAIVTGAAQGIGAATARALAREGAKVVVVDMPQADGPASKLAAEIGGTVLLCDVTGDGAPAAMADLLKARFGGRLDVVVHNAGITRDKMLVNMDEDRWRMVLDVNLQSLLRMDEVLVPMMGSGGRMVCLASIAGIAGLTGQTNYAASKAGVIGYVRALGAQLASRGIAVNAVAPGFIETQMTARIPFATREAGRRMCSLSQGGLPQDVAEAITFLSSPGAHGLSGQVVRVCGGMMLGA